MKALTADELRTSWPDARLSKLLDSAQSHLLNQQPEQAIAVWQQMIREGGGDADWGHLEYSDFLFSRRLDDQAWCELADLMAGRRAFGHPWRLAAEMLEDLGRQEEALLLYSTAVDHLSDEELRYANGPVWAREIRAGRRRLRWRMRIPLDDIDLLARMGPAELDEKWADLVAGLARPSVSDRRLPFWARTAFDLPSEESPETISPPADGYYRRIEETLQTHGGRITLLPRKLETLAPVASAALSAGHITELPAATRQYDSIAVEWPPGRNQACWCGSGIKYKRCCGAAA